MEFKDNGEFIECYDQCYVSAEDRLYGAIRKDEEGYYTFHPARRVVLTCIQLKNLFERLRFLNKD